MKPLTHLPPSRRARTSIAALAVLLATAAPLPFVNLAGAEIVPTVNLATAAEYSVLAGSAVTNTGPSTLGEGLGVSPSASLTGFVPTQVGGTIHQNDAEAAQAQADLTAAYNDAAGRPTGAILPADIGNRILQPGVYAASSRGALQLTGPLVLDGGGNADAVFIFQTDSSLTTASSSTVSVVNGASECNVFWQIGTSATLGSSSTMVGNVMADQSITLNNGVTVQGRALARIAAVTLINDTFTAPSCVPSALPVPVLTPSRRRPSRWCRARPRRPPPRPTTTSRHHRPTVDTRRAAGQRPTAHRRGAERRRLVGVDRLARRPVRDRRHRDDDEPRAGSAASRDRPVSCRSIGGLTAAHRLVTTLLVAGGVVACWGASALLVASGVEPDTAALPTVEPTTSTSALPAPSSTTLPVPAALADSWLSMRAGPVPVPIELHVPTLGIHAQVLGVGLTDRGEMDAPRGHAGDPVWERAFWYRGSAVPGATSTALVAGHASAPEAGPAVFAGIERLRLGDPVVIHDTRSGLDVRFAVREIAVYTLAQAAEPATLARIYGTGPATGAWPQPSADGIAHLTLITCAGSFRPADGTHDHRLVVYAERVT